LSTTTLCVVRDRVTGRAAMRVAGDVARWTGSVPRFARLAPPDREALDARPDLPSVVSTLCRGVAEVDAANLVVDPGFMDHGARVVAEVVARVQCPVTLAGNPPARDSHGFVLTHLAGPPALARRVAREANLWCRALDRPLLAVHVSATREGDLLEEREALGELVELLDEAVELERVHVDLRHGPPAEQLARAAADHDADIAVLGASSSADELERELALLLGAGTGTIVVLPPPSAPRRPRHRLLAALPWAAAIVAAGGAVLAHVLG
jgi:nucleotide-binding universal stress UspA family protein